jgi:hypothetical protein
MSKHLSVQPSMVCLSGHAIQGAALAAMQLAHLP